MAWRILTYHDVGWGERPELVLLGGTVPPDVLARHVDEARAHAEVVAPHVAHARLRDGDRAPLVSFWFDDGLLGVYRHALPIFAERGLAAGISVCSRFYRRTELFWRMKLSCAVVYGGRDVVLAALAARGVTPTAGAGLARATLDAFSPAVLAAIDDAFARAVPAAARAAAEAAFMGRAEIALLRDGGWTLGNHTAAHHPVGEVAEGAAAQFNECENAVVEDFGARTEFWVMPFDRTGSRPAREVLQTKLGDRALVLVGERATTARDAASGVVHRIRGPRVHGGIAPLFRAP